MRTALTFLLLALLGLSDPSAGQARLLGEQTPPTENPLPQETPEVEDPSEPPQPPPPPPAAPPMVTLGEFAVRVAGGLKLPAPASGFTPESAAWALVLKSIKVRAELGSPLTEADAIGVLNGLGYRIRTTTPSRVVSRDRYEILIDSFFSGEGKPPAPAAAPAPAAPPASPPHQGRP